MKAPGEFEQRVALVFGGAGGIGTAVVSALERRGARCVVADLQPGTAGRWIEADLREEAAVRDAVASVVEHEQRLDLLVHAAGITRDAVLWKLPVSDWDSVLAVNLRSAFLALRYGVPVLRRGGGGSIVLIGSINGARGKFGLTAYAASKAGLIGLAKSAAREVGRFDIRVNVVEPGMTQSAMTEALAVDVRQEALRETLLGRLGEPEDVAEAVAFLCGPQSRHVTGQVLRVDGGQYL